MPPEGAAIPVGRPPGSVDEALALVDAALSNSCEGISLTIAAGADFPHMLVQAARERALSSAVGRFHNALWMTSFETSVFVPETGIGFSPMPTDRIVPEVA
jgi:hypothetical protein